MSDQVTRGAAVKRHPQKQFVLSAGVLLLAAMFVFAARSPALAAGDEIFPGQNMRLPDNSLVEAAEAGDTDGMRNAIMRGIPVDDGGVAFVPAIIVATQSNHPDAVTYLLSRGANPNRKARDGRTALAVAVRNGNTNIVNILLDHKADPSMAADNGDTPLFIAVRSRRTLIVQMLISHNVDVEDTDITGRTPLDEAEERHYGDIAQLLRSASH
ncbi:MAG: ankyrin repeat domain-containing protein [Parvibaculaceae bacterium]